MITQDIKFLGCKLCFISEVQVEDILVFTNIQFHTSLDAETAQMQKVLFAVTPANRYCNHRWPRHLRSDISSPSGLLCHNEPCHSIQQRLIHFASPSDYVEQGSHCLSLATTVSFSKQITDIHWATDISTMINSAMKFKHTLIYILSDDRHLCSALVS